MVGGRPGDQAPVPHGPAHPPGEGDLHDQAPPPRVVRVRPDHRGHRLDARATQVGDAARRSAGGQLHQACRDLAGGDRLGGHPRHHHQGSTPHPPVHLARALVEPRRPQDRPRHPTAFDHPLLGHLAGVVAVRGPVDTDDRQRDVVLHPGGLPGCQQLPGHRGEELLGRLGGHGRRRCHVHDRRAPPQRLGRTGTGDQIDAVRTGQHHGLVTPPRGRGRPHAARRCRCRRPLRSSRDLLPLGLPGEPPNRAPVPRPVIPRGGAVGTPHGGRQPGGRQPGGGLERRTRHH